MSKQGTVKHIARKRFGQHFLTDAGIIDAIVRAIAPLPGQRLVEIGPGLGALTQPLVERAGHLTVIELDRDLAARLRAHPSLTVVESDVLKVNFSALPPGAGLRVVGNLPYNISTPILFHLLDHVGAIADQHFMLQKEVVDRMVSLPDRADYSRLSVMLQWRYAMEDVLFVPPQSFDPPPRVDSAVVRMVPRSDAAEVDRVAFGALVQAAFSQRRKLLRHSLGPWLESQKFSGNFDLQRRAQEVAVGEYVALAQQVSAGKPARALSILLVEDHPINQMLATTLLRNWGHTVAVANNGREGVERFATQAWDLVLMDMQMPEMGGVEATQLIRAGEPAGQHTPIIAMTANAMEADRQACMNAGMDDHLAKPFHAAALRLLLQRFAP